MSDFSGSIAKLSRADRRLRQLGGEVRTYFDPSPFEYKTEPRGAASVVLLKLLREPPLEEWSLSVGEIVHHLRSALDHLVWDLAVARQGNPGFPPPRRWEDLEFPIFDDAKVYFSSLAGSHSKAIRKRIWAVDPLLHARFDRFQPFTAKRPASHPFALLRSLANTEKHRHLALVAFYLRRTPIKTSPGIKIRVQRPRVPLIDRAEIMRFTSAVVTSPPFPPMEVGEKIELRFETSFSPELRFADGQPAAGRKVIDTLATIGRAARRAVVAFGAPPQPQLFP